MSTMWASQYTSVRYYRNVFAIGFALGAGLQASMMASGYFAVVTRPKAPKEPRKFEELPPAVQEALRKARIEQGERERRG
jgi:hypothetical protein